jgi:alpha-amylase/alpha-mannosidase (GH57 family)
VSVGSGSLPLFHICIHGHFYQPPRENPWLEVVEVQDSAAPYHDWNERVTAECYGPNGKARIQDGEEVVGLLNNYAHMSFNVGPTLLAWLERNGQEVVEALREGDRESRARRGGHSNALAQPYHHTILPLDSDRDRTTQVKWGIQAYRAFFGNDPEGMWLPETAVDIPTLEAVAEAGIRFTLLAPHQALRVRPSVSSNWTEVREDLDTFRPYLCRLPSGREIAIFFYHGAISRGVAFEGLLKDGESLYQSIRSGFRPDSQEPQLLHIATDGESYGHHHRFGEMALAYVLHRALHDSAVRLTNYGEFLALYPPTWEVEVRERTSWSCAHGVERWITHCGCRTGGPAEWHQRWRKPLREGLTDLKARLDGLFEIEGSRLFQDPWAARDDYVTVVLDPTSRVRASFWEHHRTPQGQEADLPNAMRLLEMQRHGLLMFTSCGWFFDEISGLEATQILRYAARAIQLAQYFGERLEEGLLGSLEQAESNDPQFGNGRGVWEMEVKPAAADLGRVVAHYAIRSLFREGRHAEHVNGFEIREERRHVESVGTTHLALGRVHITATATLETADRSFAAIHFGGLDISCFQRDAGSPEEDQELQGRILEVCRTLSVGDAYAMMREHFPPPVYYLKDLFVDEQRRIVRMVLRERFQEYRQTLEVLVEKDLGILARLGAMGFPIPEPLTVAATVHVNRRIHRILKELPKNGNSLDEAQGLLTRSLTWGYRPDRANWGRSLVRRMEKGLEDLGSGALGPGEVFPLCTRILETSERLEIPLNLWRVQNLFLQACRGSRAGWEEWLKEADALARRLHLRANLLPWNEASGGEFHD